MIFSVVFIFLRWVETGENLCTYKGHEGSIYSLALSSNDLFLFSSSKDSTIRQWNVDEHKCIKIFKLETHLPIDCIYLSYDDERLYYSGLGNSIKVFDTEIVSMHQLYNNTSTLSFDCTSEASALDWSL